MNKHDENYPQEVTQDDEVLATARILAKNHLLRMGKYAEAERVSDEYAQGFLYDAEEALNVGLNVRLDSLT